MYRGLLRQGPVAIATFAALALVAGVSMAKPSYWSRAKAPSPGDSEAIGYYSRGCVRGAKALAAKGVGYEIMKPARKRYFGHSELVDYLESLGKKLHEAKLGPMLIGDLGLPLGGPSPNGHASHQSGLDVDIWFWHPPEAEKRRLTYKERQSLTARSVVDLKAKKLGELWSDEVRDFLRLSVEDSRVSRALVNPVIKRHLCESESGDRSYLRKLRPWYGHADHVHVRLVCPKDSKDCEGQKALPAGDGCDELDWWFDEKAQAARQKGRKSYQKKVGAVPEMPEGCQALQAELQAAR